MNMRAQGEGFFAGVETWPYYPLGTVLGQVHRDSCVAACCRMLLYDEGQSIGETIIRAALAADPEGAYLSAVPQALAQLGHRTTYRYQAELDTAALGFAVRRGPAIAFLKPQPQAGFGHALIVDEVGGDYIRLRDPWPLVSGAAYEVKLSEFAKVWLVRASSTGFAGQAVVIE